MNLRDNEYDALINRTVDKIHAREKNIKDFVNVEWKQKAETLAKELIDCKNKLFEQYPEISYLTLSSKRW